MRIGSRNVTALQFDNTWYFNHVTQEFIDGPNLRISRAGTNIFVPGYFGIMVTRQQQFCCIFATTKDKFDYFLKKLFHSSTLHTYHHNSSLFLNRHKNIHESRSCGRSLCWLSIQGNIGCSGWWYQQKQDFRFNWDSQRRSLGTRYVLDVLWCQPIKLIQVVLLQNFMNIDGTTWFYFFRPFHFLQGLRSNNIK